MPLWTRQRYNWWLVFHLQLNGISAFPIDFPTVPKGQSRIRLMFHGGNTEAEVDSLVATICNWAKEMVEIETGATLGEGEKGEGEKEKEKGKAMASGGMTKGKLPWAAKQVYSLMAVNA